MNAFVEAAEIPGESLENILRKTRVKVKESTSRGADCQLAPHISLMEEEFFFCPPPRQLSSVTPSSAYLETENSLSSLHSRPPAAEASLSDVPLSFQQPRDSKISPVSGVDSGELGTSEEWPVVAYLKKNGLKRIAEQLAEELELEDGSDIQFVTRQHHP